MLKLHIPNMACGGRARGVTAAIRGVDAQAQVVPDLQAWEVKVAVARAVDPAALLGALKRAGFPAEVRS